jgi:hypothetical protein
MECQSSPHSQLIIKMFVYAVNHVERLLQPDKLEMMALFYYRWDYADVHLFSNCTAVPFPEMSADFPKIKIVLI